MGAWLSSCLGREEEGVAPHQPTLAEHYHRLQDDLCDLEALALQRVKTARCC